MENNPLDSADVLIEQWYQEYEPRVRGYIQKRIPCSREEAESWTNEVFVRAYASLKGQTETVTYPERWLFQFAKNICLRVRADACHYYQPESYTTLEGEERSPLDDFPDRLGEQPEVVTEKREALQEVYDILGVLPPAQRQAVLLHCRDGYSYDEIAARYPNRAVRTIRQDMKKGMNSLRTRLKPEY